MTIMTTTVRRDLGGHMSQMGSEQEEKVMFPMIDLNATGRNIVRLRKDAGLSVKDLQQVFGFATPQAIYKWQQGLALPTIDNLVVLALVLGVTMDEIIVLRSETPLNKAS